MLLRLTESLLNAPTVRRARGHVPSPPRRASAPRIYENVGTEEMFRAPHGAAGDAGGEAAEKLSTGARLGDLPRARAGNGDAVVILQRKQRVEKSDKEEHLTNVDQAQ